MAQIKKRSGSWQARIQWMDTDGKRHSKSKAGFKTKRLAQMWATEQEAKLNQGVNIEREISLYDYYVHWVDTYKAPKVSDVSMVRYRTTQQNILDFFGKKDIKKITRTEYQAFINWYGANHAPSSVQKINGFIRACVQSAILDDYLIKDFTQGVALVANQKRVVAVEYLNLSEIQKLLTATRAGLNPHFTSRYMIITAIYTGMRLSEIQGLTWKDIDFLHQTINIDKSWDAVKHEFKPTKNPSSVRKIKINPQLISILRQLREATSSTMVYINQYGTIPTSGAVNRTLRTILGSVGITKRNFHFHSLRHSHVALLLANGIDIYAISKRLGHSNIKTTANTYAYLIDEYKDQTDKQIIKALENL
ncbi:tyrosine-type recombinase/integrase [Lactobacillus sp. 3B(2020)]|uniref:site-specific integrase n=1 Tax=Lactobacillus sp. 3B(2020) TaxID=2695882 RepID=UPI0015DEB423|nr:tyrosine-type recombinase/integrase [Lactobacillus sp. 3B(2020)]QLL69762.1 tyrosine-type recombinase/integrase [Lactobacillus sp. 3B(2020)]